MNRILLHYCLIQFKHIGKFLPVRNSIKHLWKVEHNNAQDEGTVKNQILTGQRKNLTKRLQTYHMARSCFPRQVPTTNIRNGMFTHLKIIIKK